jgi:hypothetical protein
VPMLTCGLVRSNFAFATGVLLEVDLYALLHRRQVIFAGFKPTASYSPLAFAMISSATFRGTSA